MWHPIFNRKFLINKASHSYNINRARDKNIKGFTVRVIQKYTGKEAKGTTQSHKQNLSKIDETRHLLTEQGIINKNCSSKGAQ